MLFLSVTGVCEAQAPSAFGEAMGKVLTNPQSIEKASGVERSMSMTPGSKKGPIKSTRSLNVVEKIRENTLQKLVPEVKPDAQKSPQSSNPFKKIYEDALKKIAQQLEENTILTPHLRCAYTWSYEMIWRDKGTGGAMDLGVWRPFCPEGWVRLGDIAVDTMSTDSPKVPALMVKWDDNNPAGDEKGPFLAKPTDYTWLWDDKKSGADWDGSFWYPVPPKGYVSLGVVTQRSHAKPTDLGIMRCVRSDLILPGRYIGHIWTDKKSGAKKDCAVWSQTVDDKNASLPFLVTNTFHVRDNYNDKPVAPAYVIKGLSGQDAYNDAYNGYVSLVRNAIIALTQQKVADLYLQQQQELTASAGELNKKIEQAQSAQKKGSELDGSSETLEGGTTATHALTKVEFSSRSFTDSIKKITAAGGKVSLDTVPGLNQLPFIKGVEVDNAVFSQGEIAAGDEKGQPWMCLSGDAKLNFNRFGEISGKIMVLSRLYKEQGLRTGFVVLVPTEKVLSRLPGMNEKPLSQLKFSQTAVTYASEEHEWAFDELPDQIRDSFKEFSGDNSTVFNFDKGENAWLAASAKDNSVLTESFSVLKAAPPTVIFTAVFPPEKDEPVKLRARLRDGFLPKFLPDWKYLKLLVQYLEIGVGKFQGINILADLDLNLSKQLKLSLPLRFAFPLDCHPLDGISVSGLIPGIWKNPFGIKGLSIGNMAISGNFGKLPNLALGGVIDLGDGFRFDFSGALSFSSPVAISALKFKLDRDLSLGDLIKMHGILLKLALPKVKIPDLKLIDLPIDELKIKDPEFCISEIDIPALNIQKGLTVKGILALGATDLGGTDFWMAAEEGVRCKAWIRGFKIGDLGISGAGADKKDSTSDDGPAIDIEYWPLTKPPYTLEQRCYISGRVDILKARMNIFLDAAKDSLKVDLTGDLGSAFNINITGKGDHSLLKDISKGGSLYCSGEAKSDFVEDVEKQVIGKVGNNDVIKAAVKLVGDSILKIRSIKVSGSLDDFAKGKLPEVKVVCSAFGMGFTVTTPAAISDTGLKNKLTEAIAAKVIKIAEDLVKDPLAFMDNACKSIAELGEDVGKELINTFGRSPEENWKNIKNEAAKKAETVKNVAESGAKLAASTAKDLASNAEKIASKVADTMENIAKGAWDTITGWF